ncbi:TonB-dependent receptor domain-containing protein [Moritella dasanensis]|uniref:TonB-dependent receptor domain-containing protein n=1 Tax=Moritella dasanensis TaxID=428031 RepID=UPI0003138D5F|nr:TonB-dependent receptor [Moritella dasanensis]
MSKKLLAAALLPFAVLAQDPSITNPEEVTVVTANRVEQAVSDVLAPVSIVTREDIELTQAKSVIDVFRMLPGVDIGVTGGRGQSASVFIRGGESDQALVLIDGIRMVTSVSGYIDFNQIPINQVERIEFIRGARAAVYGSEAVSGVINIITKSGYEQDTLSLTAGAGSENYREGNIYTFFGVGDNTNVKLSANYETTDGYNVKPQAANAGDTHGFDSESYLIAVDHRFSERWGAYAQTRYYQNTYEYDSYGDKKESWVSNIAADVSIKYTGMSVNSNIQYRISEQDTYDYESGSGKSSDSDGANNYKQQDVNWISTYTVNDSTFSAGLDWRDDIMYAYGGSADDSRRNTGVFTNVVNAYKAFMFEGAVRLDDNEFYGTHNTWSIGSGWQITNVYQLKASISTAFKAPSLSELNSNSSNQEIKPEEAINYELGLTVTEELFDISLQVYRNEVSDLITYISYSPVSGSIFENVDGESILQGAELGLGFDLGILSNNLSLEYLDAHDAKGKELSRRAKHKAKWQGIISTNNIDWSLQYLYQGERIDGSNTLDAYSLFNASAQFFITEKLTVSARIENLFNEQYETAYGYETADRTAYLSGKYTF